MVFCVLIALLQHFLARFYPNKLTTQSLKLSALGYAIPGTVLAIGLLIPFTFADHQVNSLVKWFGLSLSACFFRIDFCFSRCLPYSLFRNGIRKPRN